MKSLTPQSILYMDDPENQRSFKALFRRQYSILTASKPIEAKKIVSESSVKIILCNQQTPSVGTIDFLKWMKSYDERIIRIFVFSNQFSDFLFERIKTQNLIHYHMFKPWKSLEMESLLSRSWDNDSLNKD